MEERHCYIGVRTTPQDVLATEHSRLDSSVSATGPGCPAEPSHQRAGPLSLIKESTLFRHTVFALSTIGGGAGISSLTGCHGEYTSYNDQLSAVRILEREATFSTLSPNSKISLQEMPKLLRERKALSIDVDKVPPHIREVVMTFEAEGVVPRESLKDLKVAFEKLEQRVIDERLITAWAKISQRYPRVFFSSVAGHSEDMGNAVFMRDGQITSSVEGPYGGYPFVYQAVCPLPQFSRLYTLIGSWVIDGKAAGIGIRESVSMISENRSRFLSHVVQ